MNKLASFLLIVIAGLQIGGVALMSGTVSLVQVAGVHSQFLIAHGINAPMLGAILQAIEFLIVVAIFGKYVAVSKAGLTSADRSLIVAELQAKLQQDLEKDKVKKIPHIRGRKFRQLIMAGIALRVLNIGEPVGDKDAGN